MSNIRRDFRFGTVGAPIETPKKPGGSVGAVIYSASLGLKAFELGWVQSVRVTEKTCEDIRSTGSAQDVALSVHASYFINLNATSEEWPKSRQRLMDAAKYGNLAGATDIIFHPGSYFQQPPEDVLPFVAPRLEEFVAELGSLGNPVRLRPETMGKSALLGSLDDVLWLGRRIPGVEPCIDFAHLYARTGDGTSNAYDSWARLIERYGENLGEEALGRLHIHLSGIEYGPKGEKKHLPIEESEFDLNAVLKALRDFNCGGRMLIESPVLEADALLVKSRWESL
ncbi:MAG TPA: TIM barrel protein [Anaerolineales bacterium]|nr:TIM barrel protein [Anaerolineales bacterium]